MNKSLLGLSQLSTLTPANKADPSIIKLTNADWHSESAFDYEQFNSNVHNDTLKISAYTSSLGDMYSGEGGNILDVSFDLVGEANESTEIEFIRFEISDSYIENTTSNLRLFLLKKK